MAAAVTGWWLWGAPAVPDEGPDPGPGLASLSGDGGAAMAVDQPAAVSPPAPDRLTVHVSGEVSEPGLAELPAGARVADAIAAAGGGLRTADLDVVNLAAPVVDGEMVRIPAIGDDVEVPSGVDRGSGDTGSDGKVAVNRADAAALETLPGVGPVLAARILTHRDTEGAFATVEDLLDVPGIGEGRLAALRDLVIIP